MDVKMADRLMELRKRHGFSQEDLADKLNISRQAISKWERAESSPDTDNLIALSKLYGISIDEMLNGENPNSIGSINNAHNSDNANNSNKPYNSENAYGIMIFPLNRQKALKIISFVFLGLGALFILIGSGLFLVFALPETLDLQLARNESIVPLNAEVTHKIKTDFYANYERQYKVAFTWRDNGIEKTEYSNAVYSELEADELVGKTVQIRIRGNRAVMVNYERSVLSLLGFIFLGVFGGIGVLFIIAFVIIFLLNKRQKQKQEHNSERV